MKWSSMGLYSDFSYEGTQLSAFSFIESLHNLNNYGLLAFDGKFMGMRSLWEYGISESFFTSGLRFSLTVKINWSKKKNPVVPSEEKSRAAHNL